MAKLTDTQLIILSKAASRDDGIAVLPTGTAKAAASKVGASLVARKLMREMRSKPGMPEWREDKDGRSMSLIITRAGRDAIGVEENAVEETEAASEARPAVATTRHGKKRLVKGSVAEVIECIAAEPRAGSKQALVIGLLSNKTGATLEVIVKATGWLPHTTRAMLSGLRKRGSQIERSRHDDKGSIYRIVPGRTAAAA